MNVSDELGCLDGMWHLGSSNNLGSQLEVPEVTERGAMLPNAAPAASSLFCQPSN